MSNFDLVELYESYNSHRSSAPSRAASRASTTHTVFFQKSLFPKSLIVLSLSYFLERLIFYSNDTFYRYLHENYLSWEDTNYTHGIIMWSIIGGVIGIQGGFAKISRKWQKRHKILLEPGA